MASNIEDQLRVLRERDEQRDHDIKVLRKENGTLREENQALRARDARRAREIDDMAKAYAVMIANAKKLKTRWEAVTKLMSKKHHKQAARTAEAMAEQEEEEAVRAALVKDDAEGTKLRKAFKAKMDVAQKDNGLSNELDSMVLS